MEKRAKNEIVKKWLIKADNDLAIVEQGLKSDRVITDILCFHCQQVAEKYLKLYIMSNGVEFSKTHNIAVLLVECSKIDSSFAVLNDTVYLTEYAVELRYPDDFYIPNIEELNKAYTDVLRIKNHIQKKLHL